MPDSILTPSEAPPTEAAETATATTDTAELVAQFAGPRADYYVRQFARLQSAAGLTWTFNGAAALFGPLWLGARGLWNWFWPFVFVEVFALLQLARGLFGDLGADDVARAERLFQTASRRAEQARQALERGAANAERLQESARYLEQAGREAMAAAEAAMAQAPQLIVWGLVLIGLVKLLEGVLANPLYERRFLRWRSDRSLRPGRSPAAAAGAAVLMLLVYPLTVYRFTVGHPPAWLETFPAQRPIRVAAATWLDHAFDVLTLRGEWVFDGITAGLRGLLDFLELVLVGTPWPVVMVAIVALAWRLVGPRVAVFTAAALVYLAVLGFWEKSMTTVALLGAAAFICVLIGIPLGIWFARSRRAYALARPVLDFMQTMPAFVYLIPVIAFFGTGKPPGIVATLIFGMPPVIRLTALGLQQVPADVREAALAFGASRWFLLFKVDLPLARPTIMTGINQTILMCLSMVVIASLIGAKGLGEEVLEALEYAAEGQGVLAGLAILFCAMVIDRLVQGRGRRSGDSR